MTRKYLKDKITPELSAQSLKIIFEEIKKINSPQETEDFLSKFFTDDEKDTLLRRLAAMILLGRGKQYEEIVNTLNISKATISNARDLLSGRNYGRNPHRKRVYSPPAASERKKRRIPPIAPWRY